MKKFNPDIVPVEQATNNSKGNFFNFLEEETVNMNTEETNLQAPVIDLPSFNDPAPKKKNQLQKHLQLILALILVRPHLFH